MPSPFLKDQYVAAQISRNDVEAAMDNFEKLRAGLAKYDGRDPAPLINLSERFRGHSHFLSDLVVLASDKTQVVSEAATWIIKAELESGQTFRAEDVKRMVDELEDVTAWQAQLHICQSVAFMNVPEEAKPQLAAWLEPLTEVSRPFLRAWSADALCKLWGPSPKANALLRRMEKDAAASVRARVRRLKQEFTST